MKTWERPASVGIIVVVVALWIGVNAFEERAHIVPYDPAPFAYLQRLLSAAALLMTVLILTSQRHENRLAEHRAQLTLELSMVSEQKIANLIELIEHQRRDNPQLHSRVDEEIKNTHSEIIASDAGIS